MGFFSRSSNTLAGRALRSGRLVQRTLSGQIRQDIGGDTGANKNDLSHRGRVTYWVRLTPTWVEGGMPLPEPCEVKWPVANWVRLLVIGLDDGSGRYEAAPDPTTIQIPVRVDQRTGRIVAIDNDTLEAELEPWRELARDAFRREQGVFREMHQAAELARDLPGLLGDVAEEARDAGSGLAVELSRPLGAAIAPEVVARRLAEADAERAALTSNPALLSGMRGAIVPMLQQKAELLRSGVVAVDAASFDLDLEVEFRRGVLRAEELAAIRGIAGTPGFGSL